MTSINLRTAQPARPAWLLLAAAESRLIARNRTILLSATLVPIAFGLMLTQMDFGHMAGAPAAMASMQLIFLQVFGVYMTVTMTLATRRQQLYLKRLRTSPVSTVSIVAGLTVPVALLVLVQSVLIFVITAAATDTTPEQAALLAVAFVLCTVMMIGLGFLTAAFTSSPEAAQFTVLPGFLVVLGGMIWVQLTSPEDLAFWHLLVPGGAPTALTRAAWEGPANWMNEVALAVGAGALVTAAVCLLAARLFRWQPRA